MNNRLVCVVVADAAGTMHSIDAGEIIKRVGIHCWTGDRESSESAATEILELLTSTDHDLSLIKELELDLKEILP